MLGTVSTPRTSKIVHFESGFVFADENFPLDVSTWKNHPDYPMHTHDFSEIVIVIEGSGINMVGEEEFRINAGDLFVLDGRHPHGYRETKDLALINITFDRSLLERVEQNMFEMPGYQALFVVEPSIHRKRRFERHLRLSPEEMLKVKAHVDVMEWEIHQGDNRKARVFQERSLDQTVVASQLPGPEPGYQLFALGHFYILIALLSRLYHHRPSPGAEKTIRIGRALAHLESHFTEPLDVDFLARLAGMSRRSFFRVFGEVTGKGPQGYLMHLRIMKAAKLLSFTEKNVTETAFDCGFEDSNYFSRQFGQIMGVSPRQFKLRNFVPARATPKS